MLASVTGSITGFVGDHSLWAVFVLMAVDAVFPAASELVMTYGGALAAGAFAGHAVAIGGWQPGHGFDAYLAIAVAGTLGYLAGSWIGWGIGVYGGRPLLERHGRWLHLDAERLDRAERFLERYSDWGVLVGRVTPVVRSFVSIPAGVFGVPLPRYSVLTLLGSAAWAFAIGGVGYGLGAGYERFDNGFRYADYVVIGLAILAVLGLGARWIRAARLRSRASDPAR